MRGGDLNTAALFSYLSCAARVPADHPLRAIRIIVDAALEGLSSEFETLYSPIGRPSIAPEKLLRALLLQAFYSVRSERQLMEQLDYNLLFRWFVGLGMDAPIWDVTVFTKNRERLLAGDVAAKFLARVLNQPVVKTLLSDEHFSVDGTLIEAWASIKSFTPRGGGERGDGAAEDGAPKGRNAERDFHAEKRSNDTHASTTDPDARLFRKGRGKEARLCHMEPFADGKPERPDRRCHADPRHRRHRRARGRDSAMLELRASTAASPHYPSAPTRRTTWPTSSIAQARDQGDPACGAKTSPTAARRSTGAPPDTPATPSGQRIRQAHRGGVRLDQNQRRTAQNADTAATPRVGWTFYHPDRRRLQPDPGCPKLLAAA